MKEILLPALAIGALGAIFALLLAIASKIFYIEQDERLPKVTEALPGANCGGCGYAGCSNLASAIVEGKAPVNSCPVGGAEVAKKIAAIMGQEVGETVKKVAHVNCSGGINAQKKFEYSGIHDGVAASKVQGGPLVCSYGCLGFGTCKSVCPYGAIEMENGVAKILADKCKACGKCVAACPRGLISIVSFDQDVFVSCSNHNKGAELRSMCNIGCIGCSLCVKNCPHDAIHVDDFCAHIDYDKCTNCGKCVEVCPRKLIKSSKMIVSDEAKDSDE